MRLRIEPGLPTTVTSVGMIVTGAAALGGPQGDELTAQREWPLQRAKYSPGLGRQQDRRGARVHGRKRYAAAKLVGSRAEVDPEARTAALSLTVVRRPAIPLHAARSM